MKLLTLTDMYPNDLDPSSGVFVQYLNKALSDHLEITIVHPYIYSKYFPLSLFNEDFSSYERQGNVEVYHLPMFTLPRGDRLFLRGIFFFLTALKLLLIKGKNIDFDLIHAHMAVPAGFAGVLLSKIFRKPVIITCHGSDINVYPRIPVLRQMVKYSLKKSEVIVTVSNDLKEKAKLLGVGEDRIKVIPNGVDIDIFRMIDKLEARKDLGLKNEGYIIVYVGHLIKEKGLEYLLRSIFSLIQEGIDVRLFLIGEGKDKDFLVTMTKALRIEENIFFLSARPNHEIPKWLGASDLLCLPSLSEGLPCVILEALACGRPIVASDVGGVSEVIKNQDQGILVLSRNIKQLTNSLNMALKIQWDSALIKSSVGEYTWKNVAKKYLDLYRELIQGI